MKTKTWKLRKCDRCGESKLTTFWCHVATLCSECIEIAEKECDEDWHLFQGRTCSPKGKKDMNIDKTKLEELQAKHNLAIEEQSAVRRQMRDREEALMAEVRKTLEKEFGAMIDAAAKIQREAEREMVLEAGRIRTLESESRLPYPEGTILKEWTWHVGFSGTIHNLRLTGEVGVIEIFKEGDEISANVRWSKPLVGNIVLRMLKKDGTKGKDVRFWSDGMKREWLPDGKKPF